MHPSSHGPACLLPCASMPELQEGTPAPAIECLTDTGETFRLSDLQGQSVVLYFYPKADTPGCTTESCEFRDAIEDLRGMNATVIGVSPDTPKAQAKFKEKFQQDFDQKHIHLKVNVNVIHHAFAFARFHFL